MRQGIVIVLLLLFAVPAAALQIGDGQYRETYGEKNLEQAQEKFNKIKINDTIGKVELKAVLRGTGTKSISGITPGKPLYFVARLGVQTSPGNNACDSIYMDYVDGFDTNSLSPSIKYGFGNQGNSYVQYIVTAASHTVIPNKETVVVVVYSYTYPGDEIHVYQ